MSKRARAVNRLFVDYIVLLKWSIRSILFPFDSIPSATQNRLLYATAAMLVRCLRSLERDTRSNEHAQCTNLYIYTVDIWYGMVYMCVLCCIYVYISTCNFGKENHDIMARVFFYISVRLCCCCRCTFISSKIPIICISLFFYFRARFLNYSNHRRHGNFCRQRNEAPIQMHLHCQ